jgi:hypothetical protein
MILIYISGQIKTKWRWLFVLVLFRNLISGKDERIGNVVNIGKNKIEMSKIKFSPSVN